MGLAWQQGPLAAGSVGHFLTAEPLPERLLFVEPLRRRMRARQGAEWIADSENVLLLHEPGRYPVAYFPIEDIRDGVSSPRKESPNTVISAICSGTPWSQMDGRSLMRRGSTPGCRHTRQT